MSDRTSRDRPLSALWLGPGVVLAALGGAWSPACLERREVSDGERNQTGCTSCHGDPTRAGSALSRAAPPGDLDGLRDPSYPGVGAHAHHVAANPTHAAVECRECHVVPERVDSPGHADDGAPAELRFGPLAAHGDREPRYDPSSRACSQSYCHGDERPVWTSPRSSSRACGTCHGLPPAPPHPQSERCSACHGDVLDADHHFIAPERHVDGTVDFSAGDCVLCHGDAESPAPPTDTAGETSPLALGVGAHRAHLTSGRFGRPLECGECHVVPETVADPGHADGLPAEVVLSGRADSHGRVPVWDRGRATCNDSWCHSPSSGSPASPAWNQPVNLDCRSCHGLPPPAPHPAREDCTSCHGDIVGADNRTLREPARHVDGVVDLSFEGDCTACHGDAGPAPPRDLVGNTSPEFPGVGAHQTHVLGTERSRAVPCGECHQVPDQTFEPGHLDSEAPAELAFAGAAIANDAAPRYENGRCHDTACHGGKFEGDHRSGGTNTAPLWTRVDGSETTCGSCHGLPPPPPHPNSDVYPCHACHFNVADDDRTFLRPELHVDGRVTLQVE